MIYIEKSTNDQYIITDNVVNYLPTLLDIYLDDVYIGQFTNLSDNKLFITFQLSPIHTTNLIEREYTLTIKSYGATIKQELSQVRDFNPPIVIQYNK